LKRKMIVKAVGGAGRILRRSFYTCGVVGGLAAALAAMAVLLPSQRG